MADRLPPQTVSHSFDGLFHCTHEEKASKTSDGSVSARLLLPEVGCVQYQAHPRSKKKTCDKAEAACVHFNQKVCDRAHEQNKTPWTGSENGKSGHDGSRNAHLAAIRKE